MERVDILFYADASPVAFSFLCRISATEGNGAVFAAADVCGTAAAAVFSADWLLAVGVKTSANDSVAAQHIPRIVSLRVGDSLCLN
jgi:hypothetical protein